MRAGRDGSHESPRQRLERLRAETRELEHYLETVSASAVDSDAGTIAALQRTDLAGLRSDVEQLRTQLGRIGADAKFHPLLDADAGLEFALAQQGELSKQMMASIGAIAGGAGSAEGGTASGADRAHITYELFMQRRGGSGGGGGAATPPPQALKYGALEDRLAALERAVGGSVGSGGRFAPHDVADELAMVRRSAPLVPPRARSPPRALPPADVLPHALSACLSPHYRDHISSILLTILTCSP